MVKKKWVEGMEMKLVNLSVLLLAGMKEWEKDKSLELMTDEIAVLWLAASMVSMMVSAMAAM
jgi:hypothetical protein